MKNYIFALLSFTLVLPTLLKSQELNKKEIGISTSNLNSFTITYKKQWKGNKYINYSLGSTNIQINPDPDNNRITLGLSLGVTFEKRSTITDKLVFARGFSPDIQFSYQKNGSNTSELTMLSMGYSIGFQYHVNDKFYFETRTVPAISSSFSSNDVIIRGNLSDRAELRLFYKF